VRPFVRPHVLECHEPGFELIDSVLDQFQLRLGRKATLGGVTQPRRRLCAGGGDRKRHQPGGPVRAFGQPRRDLAASIPAPKRRAGRPGLPGRDVKGHPVRAIELGRELQRGIPVIDPVVPVHVDLSSLDPAISIVLTRLPPSSTLTLMFERFTARARHVIVLAQDESRRLNHNYIGTEHMLLGLLAEGQGVAGQVLDAEGVTLEQVRARVEAAVGRGKKVSKGHIPFTPRAKKVLELGLREALSLRHDYIGTEHLLLGLIREGEGLGSKVLRELDIDLLALRVRILDLVPPGDAAGSRRRHFWPRQHIGVPAVAVGDDLRTTAAADVSLDEARRLAGETPVGSHHLLLATLSDPTSAAAKALSSMGIDLDQARSALRDVDVAGTTDEQPEEAGRRQLVMRLDGSTLVLETSDPMLVEHANAALVAIGSHDHTIRGDDPRGTGFSDVWRAWRDALEAISGTGGEDQD
jgi:Clp amino terminal domain, pathogenicity island component